MRNIVVLPPIVKQNWIFRASTLEEEGVYSIMIVCYDRKNTDRIYVRYFTEDEKASAFVQACADGNTPDIEQ